jgi:predicted transposase YdaD
MANTAISSNSPPPSGPSAPDPARPGRQQQPPGQPSPHDALFRLIFGVPENIASELRAVLPPALANRLDLDRLAPVPASFVDESLKWRHSDLVFTVPWKGQDSFAFMLVEHQSNVHALMAFRVLRYMTRILDAHERGHPQTRRLPRVIPAVVYPGRSRWTSPTRLQDLFDPAPAQDEEDTPLPRFGFFLDDLSVTGVQQLQKRELTPAARVALALLKYAPGSSRVTDVLWPLDGDLRAVLDQPGGNEVFIGCLTYILTVSETPETELRRLAAALGPDAEEVYVTTAEKLEARGEARGIARGTVLSEAHWRAKALVQILTVKFGTLPGDLTEEIQAASSSQIQEWTTLAVNAGSLDEIFR